MRGCTPVDRFIVNALDEWVQAVNAHGGFGRWHWAVARRLSEIGDVLARVQTASTT